MQKITKFRAFHCYSRRLQEEEQTQFLFRPIEADKCVTLIKQCGNLKALKSVHASMLRSNLHLNLFFSTNLISQYASLGYISHAFAAFSAAETSDIFLWNVMIRGFVDNGCYERSLSLYFQMWPSGILPDNFTFPYVLKACGCLRDLESAVKIHRDVVDLGYESDTFVGNSLIAVYGKCQRCDIAREMFDKMPDRNIVSWNSVIGACAQNGQHEEGVSLLLRMLNERIKPNKATVLNAMGCVDREMEANKLYRVAMENGLNSNQCVQNAAMRMYARCGRIDIARNIFDGVLTKDLVFWSSMIEAYAQADLPSEALDLFKQMKRQGILPDYVTLLSVIRACGNLASFHQARLIHGYLTRNSFKNGVALGTALVDVYVKCGSIKYARKVFDKMPERNLISWTTMISGYGMNGHGREALSFFDQMKTSLKPDHIAFVSVLSACSHDGLITEGWECFNSMSRDYGIEPRPEHYACMVDLLGRAGQLSEAQNFIERMPIRPDSGVWGALLGACRIHSNVELAEKAAKSLFDLDPKNPGRYILLSNIYTSSGKLEQANQIRSLMELRGVKKTVSYTNIEIKDRVYTFVVGDRSIPQTELLYSELEKLMGRIRHEGYVPDLNFVFHDVEEETKEKMLYMHSEKLAIVFGLLNTAPGSTIRMTKNLRVCGDCHTATKYISKVTGREIVVRDSRRFHHFKEGLCSCLDYW